MTETNPQRGSSAAAREIVRGFREAWAIGDRPDLEEFASQVPEAIRGEVFAELLNVEVAHRRNLGEDPSPTDYVQRFPGDQPTISAVFNAVGDTIQSSASKRDPILGSTEVDIAVGEKLGKYEIRVVLGVGGMGVVFGAYDTIIHREVAIKLLSTKNSANETALSRLLQEARMAGAVHHPNIVGIYDVLEVNGAYYVVMEKVDGSNLNEVLKNSERGYLDWKLATRIAMACCDALAAAHSRGMIHRDIKPQNIMLTVESTVKLLDFGLAKSAQNTDTGLTQDGTILGTPDFMSPEQCSAGEIQCGTDIYSLGATYFMLLTGHPPFASLGTHLKVMFAHCNRPIPAITAERPEIPTRCEAVINRAMAKQVNDRYQSASEFRADLEELLSPVGGSAHVVPHNQLAPSGTETRPSFPLWAALAGVGLVCVALVILLAGWNAGDSRPAAVKTPEDTSHRNVGAPFRGVTADTIQLGTTTAFNGPSKELGRDMVIGMKTYFDSVNAAGGIHGRRIELTVLDDHYDPATALENMKQLFEQRQVFAVIGNVGTPTAKVTAAYASEHGYLFFAPFTGASLLRTDPPDRYIFNYRASYQDETAAMVKYFVETLDIAPREIAVFAQNDAYGDDGFSGVARAMKAYGVKAEELLRVGYDRNQLDIDAAVAAILDRKSSVRAVVMVPTYKVAARFIQRIKSAEPDMLFGAVSFVGSQALAEEFREIGAAFGAGVIVTQVVPPYLTNATGVLKYRELLNQYNPEYEPSFVSLEGFVAASVFVEGLRRTGPALTTESLIDAFHQIDRFDLGIGPIITFSPSRHQASHRVWGTRITADCTFEPLDLE